MVSSYTCVVTDHRRVLSVVLFVTFNRVVTAQLVKENREFGYQFSRRENTGNLRNLIKTQNFRFKF